jgi:catechol-2,3-dioxygenase
MSGSKNSTEIASMSTVFSHIALNVSQLDAATKFYLDALEPLGFTVAIR